MPDNPPQTARAGIRKLQVFGKPAVSDSITERDLKVTVIGPHISTWDPMFNLAIVTEQRFDPCFLVGPRTFAVPYIFPFVSGKYVVRLLF